MSRSSSHRPPSQRPQRPSTQRPSHRPPRRLRVLAVTLAACGLLLGAMLADAARRRDIRSEEASRHAALVDATAGLADLALSSSARWLRHPSQAEPGAATSDLPSSLDVDPAGALLGPPREVLQIGGVEVQTR